MWNMQKKGFRSGVEASGQIQFLECFPTKNTGIGQQEDCSVACVFI